MSEEHLIWNNTVDRLLQSEHPVLESHYFLGTRYLDGLPMIVPAARENPHVWVMGGSGTGKTARVLAPLTAQQIARGMSVVVLDPKPDKAYFEACRDECHHQGIPFRWVDITPGRWTYAFSPFAQPHSEAQTLTARTEVMIQALNLDYGSVYGGSYFTAMDELFCQAVLSLFPEAKTAAEMARRFDHPEALKKLLGEKGWESSSHVRAIFAKLAGTTALNVTPRSKGVTQAVLDAAIDLRQPFYQPQVVYFALDAKELRTTTRSVIGLAFYNLLAAAKYVGPNPAAKVVCVIDEAQEVIGTNLSILLEQARSLGIELVLAHQNLNQLKKNDHDFRETLEENAGLQLVFNPSGQASREWLEKMSGERLYTELSWEQDSHHGFDPHSDDAFDPEHARWVRAPEKSSAYFEFPKITAKERLGPIWTKDTLMRLSTVPGLAWARLLRDEGLAQYEGEWTPTRTLFHAPRSVFEHRKLKPWPGPNGQTVLVERSTAYDRRFEEPPPPSAAAEATKNKIRRSRKGR